LKPHPGPCIVLVCLAICLCSRAFSQTTAPTPRTADAIKAEIEVAHQQFNRAVTSPADISDPARRKLIAPQAIPPLKTMVNDFAELARQDAAFKLRASQLQLQFNAFLSVLGDQPTIDALRAQSQSKDLAQSLRAQSSQILARWVLSGKDQTAQANLAEQIEALDRGNPSNADLTFLTFTTSQSTASAALELQLLEAAKAMKNPIADKIRKAADAPAR
jgi:hypothetical protein